MGFHRATALVLTLVLVASFAYAPKQDRTRLTRAAVAWRDVLFGGAIAGGASGRSDGPADLTAYEGLGSWIDIFNRRPWAKPGAAVRRIANRGAKTIFLQTSTYGQSGGIFDEAAVNAFLRHAHRRGLKVVAWYVPSFAQQRIDLQRSLRAINYRSPSGETFDSFGLDIEATHVADISVRNDRLLALSRRIRKAAGISYPLSAITPDPIASAYWPSFPWKETAKIYDVIVPMGYFTFRARGFEEVHEYTTANIKKIRRETKDKDVPIHFIGGIADDAGPVELKGFLKASREQEVIGASLYDYAITSPRSWYEMRALDRSVAQRRRRAALERRKEAAERARLARKEKRAERRIKAATDDLKGGSLTGSRNPSSSASRRDKRSEDRRERERRHRRVRDRRHRKS